MNAKKWIALGIVLVAVVGSLGLVKLFPFWATPACLVTLAAGFLAGFLFKNPDVVKMTEVVTKVIEKEVPVEVVKEVIKEVPVKETIPDEVQSSATEVPVTKKKRKSTKKE